MVIYLFWRGLEINHLAWSTSLILGIAGLFVWTFVEYFLHRHLFHLKGEKPWQQRLRFLIHGLHHDDPEDPTRLVMPPVAAIVLASLLYGFFRIFLGPVWIDPFFSCFLIGYLCYDYIHYAVHHFRPRTPIGKFLKQSHMLHHFVNHESRWGVSSPLWDIVFGTTGADEQKGAPSHRPSSA